MRFQRLPPCVTSQVLNKMDQLGTENVEPSDDVLKYGLGDAPEASRVHRLHAVNAVIHGARCVCK